MPKRVDLIALVGLLLTVIGGTVGTLTYFAKADDLKLVEYRLDQKIKADQIYFLQQRLWQLYDRFSTEDCSKMPHPSCAECRRIKAKINELQKARS